MTHVAKRLACWIAAVAPLLALGPATAQDRPAGDGRADAAAASRFVAVDLLVDPRGRPLAAWQIEFAAEVGQVSLVGVEAGEHPAYAKRPAYYDPAALAGRRVIVGDYSLDPALPNAKTRVARLMLEVRGAARPQYVAKVMAAADPEGRPIDATVAVRAGP